MSSSARIISSIGVTRSKRCRNSTSMRSVCRRLRLASTACTTWRREAPRALTSGLIGVKHLVVSTRSARWLFLTPKGGMLRGGRDGHPPRAAALKRRVGAVAGWGGGHRRVPAGVWKELREVVRLHGLKIADLDPEIVQAYDTAIALASKARA